MLALNPAEATGDEAGEGGVDEGLGVKETDDRLGQLQKRRVELIHTRGRESPEVRMINRRIFNLKERRGG
jgi:hypothetical protein